MYTLEQIYQKFYTGTVATKQSGGFAEPGSAPGSTMHTLDNIYGDFATDAMATNGTTAADVRSGKTFFATSGTARGTTWGPVAGSIANCSSEGGNACYASGGAWTGNTGSAFTVTGSGGTFVPIGYYPASTYKCTAALTGGTGSLADGTNIITGYHAYDNTGAFLNGSVTAGNDVSGAAGSLSFSIPTGYYSGKNCIASDTANLVAGKIKLGATIFGVAGTMYPGAVVTTGQITTSPTANYAPFDDGDVNYRKGLSLNYSNYEVGSTPQYVAVNDLNTGLMWQKCPYGLSDTNKADTCVGGAVLSYKWNNLGAFDAINACENLVLCSDGTFSGSATVAGTCSGSVVYSDWRLPNVKELFSLTVEEAGAIAGVKDAGAPYIDQIFFPNKTVVSATYWSSTTSPNSATAAFTVGFSFGSASNIIKTSAYSVRCVRGQQNLINFQ